MTWKLLETKICCLVLASLLVSSGVSVHAQAAATLTASEEKLKQLFEEVIGSAVDEERVGAGDRFAQLLRNTLLLDGSYGYDFPLLPNLSVLTSPDNRFRIYTWNVPLHSGSNKFYGLIQLNPSSNDSAIVVDLCDHSRDILHPEEEILSPERWYGAVYYTIISQEAGKGDILYTVLGWHGENMLLTSKLIDIITINQDGDIRFGRPVFCHLGEKLPSRILFRHSVHASMSLRYEEQRIVTEKKWNPKRKEFEVTRRKALLIVADRLVPSDPKVEGQYEYYLPAGDVMDGFLFRDGCWNFIEHIDARNAIKK